MKRYPLISFYILALVLSGVVLLPLLAVGLNDLYFLATFGPGIAGLIVARVADGRGGFLELLRRILIWRIEAVWWLALLLLPIVIALSGALASRPLGSAFDFGALPPLYTIIPSIILLTLLNGFTEEYGWRGFALPRLQARYNALTSSLILGFFWGLWHIPIFFVEGTFQQALSQQSGLAVGVAGFTFMTVMASVAFTWLFNHTRGSVLVAGLFHGMFNAWIGYFTPDLSDALSMALGVTICTTAIAVIITLVFGPAHLSRTVERNTIQIG